ncbi:hypothetical protein Tco_1114965 [Tanacetum coccineum]
MVAYLEKTDGNAEFHEIIDFLTRSSIHYALTVSPVVSTIFVEQFWMSSKSKIINNVRYITAKVAGKPVNISEASIRSDLLFDDADGIDSLHNQAIFDAIQLMGYEGDLTVLTFNKALFSPQWRFLFHTMNHCISSKSTSWDQIPTNIATAVICLATNQKYNFSKLIFDGMMRHLDAKKKFVMYPRFISVFLDKQLKNVPVPLDHFPINALTSKVFSFMVKKGKHFSGNVTPLFESMLVQPTEDEGEASERQSEPQPTPSPPHPSADQHETQPDPSPRPSPTIPIPDSIPEGSGGNHGGQSSSDRSLSGNEDGLTLQSVYDLCVSLCKQGRKSTKSTLTAHTDQVFDDVDVNDAMDYMETDAYMQKGVSTEDQVSTVKLDEGTEKPKVSTNKPEVSTAKPKEVEVSTDKLDEGTAKPKDGTSDESTTPTTVFKDDETIAEFLVSMSQNKAKQKGVKIKDAEDSDRPRATSTRSVLTLKPLPKIDPKDKGKKVLEEEAESDAESEGVDEAERKFDQLAKDEEIARKVQEDWEAEEEMKKLAEEEATKAALIQDFDDIQARIEADRLLAARLQEEERETFTVEERAKFLYDTIAAQRRFLAQQRAAAIRSRPPTRTQLRNQMMTYLKHVGGKKHADLKNKNFEEIQVLYKKVKRSDKDFIAIGSAEDERQIKEMNEESKDPKKKRTDAYMQKGVSTEDQVSTVKPDEGTDKPKVSTDKPEVSTAKPKEVEVSTDKLDEGTAEPKDGTSDESTAPTTVFRDDETIAEFLVSMSQNKAKQKGVEIKDAEDSDRPRATSTRSVLTLKPLPKIDPKDKGKKVLEEEAESDAESEGVDEAERKFDQLAKDEEIARKVQEDWEAEEDLKKLAEEEATKAALIQDFDDIQARIEADRLLAARLQEEERETFTVEERAKFLYDTIAAQRRFLAQQRAAAIKSRPPTRTQLRNQMMTYLKHVGGKKHVDLKNKNFEEIQVLYKEVKRSDKNFIAIGSAEDERQIKEMNEESKDTKRKRLKKRVVNETPREEDTTKVPTEQEVTKQGTKKRKNSHVKMIARKRPRPQPDDDSDDEHRKCLRIVTFNNTIDSKIMEAKYFVSKLHKVSSPDGDYLVVYRVNGHFRAFNYLMEILHIFDRQDLFHLYDLVMKHWRLYEACGVCILELKDGTVIYMLVERRYPFSKELLQRMLNLGLEVKEESTVALHLVRFIKQQLNEEHQELTSPEANGFCEELASPGSNSSWLSIHLVVYNEELAIPEQTTTGKGISNPLMAGSLPKTTKPT